MSHMRLALRIFLHMFAHCLHICSYFCMPLCFFRCKDFRGGAICFGCVGQLLWPAFVGPVAGSPRLSQAIPDSTCTVPAITLCLSTAINSRRFYDPFLGNADSLLRAGCTQESTTAKQILLPASAWFQAQCLGILGIAK